MTSNHKKSSSNAWLIFLVTSLGVGMATLDGGIVNVALPSMSKNFTVGISMVQWVVSGYLLMICILLPLCGYLGDIFTKKRVYLSGFCIFTISSLLCSTSFSLLSLIIYRSLQGIGAAMLMANNQAIIMSNFPKKQQGKALGANAMIVAIGSIAGPGIGGILIGLFGWRSIFYINIPIGLLGFGLGLKLLPKETSKSIRHFDYAGAVLFMIMMLSFTSLLNHGAHWGWVSLKSGTALMIAIIFFVAFLAKEKVAQTPMIDLTIFKNWALSSGNIASFFVFVALFSNMILLPFFLDELLHMSSTTIGTILFVAPMCILLLGPISGHLINHYNSGTLTAIGATIMFIGLFSQSFLTVHSTLSRIVLDQSLIGIGCGFFSPPNNHSMLSSVPSNKLGVTGGIASLVRNMGKICGIAIATSIFTTLRNHASIGDVTAQKNAIAFTFGFRGALMAAAFFAFMAAIIACSRRKCLANRQLVETS